MEPERQTYQCCALDHRVHDLINVIYAHGIAIPIDGDDIARRLHNLNRKEKENHGKN